ncbi:MAG TPA: hypothetical protein VKY74_19030 [Chloroflexia bacterium]|nr:hypothetical protein [Chloroflexia bacterium]
MTASNLAGLIGLILGGLILGAALSALLLLGQLVFPRLVARAQQTAERMPGRALVVGLINFIFFGVLAVALSSRGPILGLLAGLVFTALCSGVALGLSAIAGLVGARLRPGDPHPSRQLVAGALLLELAALVPVVGWLAVPALAGLIGLGATLIALVGYRRSP